MKKCITILGQITSCPLITTSENEPFKHVIQQLASCHLTAESTSSIDEKIDGIIWSNFDWKKQLYNFFSSLSLL